ncbi:PspA/IM30 family protein [Spirosoma koreense]
MTTFPTTSANNHTNRPNSSLPGTNDSLPPVNLHKIGYEKAEQHRGNAQAFGNLLNRILRGYLVDESNNTLRQEEKRQNVASQVLELEKQVEAIRTQIRQNDESAIPALEEAIRQEDEQIQQIRRDEVNGVRNPDHRDRMQLGLYSLLLGLLTFFVYLFYTSAFYSGFFRDLPTELKAAGPEGQTSVLSAIFSRKAFTTLDFHWAGPLMLFAFGGFLHVLLAIKTRLGRLLTGVMVALIAMTDGLIAYFVEAKNNEVKVLMGLAEENDHTWWSSPVFWLVIAMGFVAAMVWSGLLQAVLHEFGKKDVARLAAIDIKHCREKQQALREQINTLKGQTAEYTGQIAQIELDIKALEDSRQSVVLSPSELEKHVTDFYDGWLTYINNRMGNDAGLRDDCARVMSAFYTQHLTND